MRVRTSDSDGLPRPEEFPLGSTESRAAARAMLDAQRRAVRRVQIIHSIPHPNEDDSRPHVGHWQQWGEGGLMRLIYVPPGTDEETTRHLLATR